MKSIQKNLDAVLSVLSLMGWKSSDFTEAQILTLRAGTAKREFHVFFASLGEKPLIALALPIDFSLPAYEDMYSRYLDFNFDIYLLLRRLEETSPETGFLLYFDDSRAYFYNVKGQERLIYCSNVEERSDRLFPHLERKKVENGSIENLVGKPTEQLANELNGWLQIWSAQLGSGAQAKRKTLDRFLRKLVLARYYTALFGCENPALLFDGFVNDPDHIEASRRLASPYRFLTGLFDFFKNRFSLSIFQPGKSETSFLSKADKIDNLLHLFLLEFNLLARVKFSLEVFLSIWCSESERLISTKKAYTTDRPGLKQRWAVEDMAVLKPVEADIVQEGAPWTLHLFDELAQYWIKYNQTRNLKKKEITGKDGGKSSTWVFREMQMDMFGASPDTLTDQGTIPNILNFTLQSSIRLKGVDSETQREILLFLFCAKCFEMWKKYDLPRESLDSLECAFQKGIG
ncbi:hypothetical protein JW926_00410 [Candidatus Sumerlaeota bacterium]|nr:hypothetical protein [Candidatus Sumerlaeota bacterium]